MRSMRSTNSEGPKAIAAAILPTENAQFVAVDLDSGRFETGKTASAAAVRLGSRPERILALRTGPQACRGPFFGTKALV